MSARVYEADIGDLDSAIRHYRKVLEIDPKNLAAAESLERIFQSAERYQELSQILQQKADILDELAEKKAALFQAASDRGGRPRAARSRHRRLRQDPRARRRGPRRHRRADQALPGALALGRSARGLRQEGGSGRAIRRRRSSSTTRSAPSTSASSATSPRAIDTYQRVLELDPDDLQALGRLDVLYQTAQNWPELLSVLQHESELATDPAEGISYQYRIAELYEKHLDDTTRAIELYRDLLQQMPDHQPTLDALEGIKAGAKDPLGAALVLEPVYDATGEWNKLISVLEVQVKARRRSVPEGRAPPPHRAPPGGDAPGARRRVRDLRPRRAERHRQRGLARATSSASPMVVARWKEVARPLRSGARQALRGRRPLRRAGPAPRADLRDAARGRGERGRPLPPRPRGRRREPGGGLRARSALHHDRAVGRARRDPQARGRDRARARTRSSSSSTASGSGLPDAAQRSPLGDRRLQGGARRRARARRHARGARGPLRRGREPDGDRRDPRAALPGVRRVGQARRSARGRARAPHRGRRAPRDVLPDRRAPRGAPRRARRRAQRLPARPQGVPRRREDARGGRAPRAARPTAAGSCSPTPTPTCSAPTPTRRCRPSIGKRLARVFEEELGDVQKAEETYQYVLSVEPLDTEALGNLDRIYTAQEQYPELARTLEQRVLAPAEPFELIELYGRLGQVYEERLVDLDHAIVAFRRIFDELEKTNERGDRRPRAHLRAEGRVDRPQGRPRARARERVGRHRRRPTSARRWRTSTPTELNDIGGGRRHVEARPRAARRGPGGARRAREPLRARRASGPSSATSSSGTTTSRPTTSRASTVLLRRAKLFNDRLGRDDSALDDYNRVLDIDYANVEALYAIADIWRRRNDPQQIVTALHQTVDRAAAGAAGGEPRRALPRARHDRTRPSSTSRTTRSTPGGSCSRSTRATSRPWPRSRACSAPRSAGPRSSTSRWPRAEAYEDAAGEGPRVPRGRRRSGRTRSARRTAPRRHTRRSSRSTRPTTRPSSRSRSCTTPRTAASR